MKPEKNSPYSAFFLHGGPGFCAEAERHFIGESLGVYWWDQPRPQKEAPRAFLDLVDAAVTEFSGKAKEAGGQVSLLANSFGAQIALHLASRVPQLITGITLLAPTYDVKAGFIHFAKRLTAVNPELVPAAAQLDADRTDTSRFWHLAATLMTTPGFADMYWSREADVQRQWMNSALSDPRRFDFGAFQAILNSSFHEPLVDVPSRFTGPVSIVFGSCDPLLDPAATGKQWLKHFPHAEIRLVDAGHLPHLELPADAWWRERF